MVYSSQIRGNKNLLTEVIANADKVSEVFIHVRQNPQKNVFDVSGGVKETWEINGKNRSYYRCSVTKKGELKRILRLIQLKIDCIHYVQFY